VQNFTLPGTSLVVSKIGLGTASLHHSYLSNRRRILKASLDSGITHFDTARLYGNGISETTIGNYFSSSTRQSLTIATKVGFEVSRAQQLFPIGSKIFSKTFGFSQQKSNYSIESCERSLSASLKALKSEWVDILFLHEPLFASRSQIDCLLPWFRSQQVQGKARFLGLAGDNLVGSMLLEEISSEFNVIQTNTDSGPHLSAINQKSHIQYGLFRGLPNNLKDEVWRKIRKQNFDGMVLYSSRNPGRIKDLNNGL
jgi:aryl-alcohol dehydrogenase-like predicted oxidoreductase